MIPEPQQLRDAYQKAPKMVQEFITSPELSATFTEICDTHKLHLDEAGALSDALNTVFFELVPFEEFPNLLKEALEQNSDKHDAILKEVNEKVFAAFKQKLKEPAPVAPTPTPERTVLQEKTTALNTEKPPVHTPNKLETSTRTMPQEVDVSPKPEAPQQQNASGYTTGADPYLEPIE